MTTEEFVTADLMADAQARKEALDVTRSFLVKAPAGSGKTQLLTLRLLALLSVADEPEEVLAITFTRAATAEMRDRVMGALRRVEALLAGAEPHLKGEMPGTRVSFDEKDVEGPLALAAYEQSLARGWGLLEQPGRLNIQTIDSLCLQIAHETPLLSKLGGHLQPTEDAKPLYALAARRTMERLASGPDTLREALTHLLQLRNVQLGECEALIAEMLGGRDQWLFEVAQVKCEEDWTLLRARLEEPLRQEHARVLGWVKNLLRGAHGERMLALAEYACGNEPMVAIHDLRGKRDVEGLVHAGHLRCVRELLLTQGNEWRKRVDKSLGFPAGTKGLVAERKGAFMGLLTELRTIDGLLEALCAVDELPSESFADDEWRTVRSVFTVLLHAAGQLRVVFAERGAIDFVEAGITAAHALVDGEVRRRWSGRVRHLLVDEFQDTSRRQYELLKQIVSGWEPEEGRTCFLVGDPMQSVYLFRHAEPALFDEVQRHGFSSGADAIPFGLLTLRRNFRSTAGIVGPLNALFSELKDAREFVPAVADEGSPQEYAVHVVGRFEDEGVAPEVSEAAQAVAAIRPHLDVIERARVNGEEFRVGVLVRAKWHVAEIAEALRKAGIGYRAIEIETLGERQEVRDVLSMVRALLSPLDRVAWLAVLRAPWCGLTLKDLHVLCGEDDEALMRRPIPGLLRERMELLSTDGQARAFRTAKTMKLALEQRFAGAFGVSPVGFVAWVERTWMSLGGRVCVDAHAYENVQAIFRLLGTITPDGMEAAEARLAAKMESLFAQPLTDATEKTGVQLMTIHKAKGLGFDVVLVPGMEKKTGRTDVPLLHWMARKRHASAERELLVSPIGAKGDESSANYKWVCAQKKREKREEVQRLLYVACTRARSELHLLGKVCVKDGKLADPAKGSLLAAGWAGLKENFESLMAARPVGGPVLVESAEAPAGIALEIAAASTPVGQVLRRLPVAWGLGQEENGDPSSSLRSAQDEKSKGRFPTPPHKDRVPGAQAGRNDKGTGGYGQNDNHLQRVVGVVVHALFEQMASLSEGDGRRNVSATAAATYWKNVATALLRNTGLSGRELVLQVGRVVGMVARAVGDPHGRWILGLRQEGRSESGWSSAAFDETGGGVRNLRADRVFVAGDAPLAEGETHLWIVDYKTALAGKGDGPLLPGILMDERERHEAQLAGYGRVLREALGSKLPMRLALYYPEVPHLEWWAG